MALFDVISLWIHSLHSRFSGQSDPTPCLGKRLCASLWPSNHRTHAPSSLPSNGKGMHLVTDVVVRECQEGLKNVDIGVFTLCCLHTSAGLTVRYQPRVRIRSCMCRSTRTAIRRLCAIDGEGLLTIRVQRRSIGSVVTGGVMRSTDEADMDMA